MVFDCEVLWSIIKLNGYKIFFDKFLFHSNSILDPNELLRRNFEWGTIGLGNHVSQQCGIKYWGK